MNILGINLGHDTSSTLIKNGEVVAACEEERYTKIKHSRSFPLNSINDCLKIGNIKIKDVDIISVGWLPKKHVKEFYFNQVLEDSNKIDLIKDGFDRIKEDLNLESIIRTKLNYKNKIEFNSHHLSHLASAFYPSGFNNSLILSLDGIGEFETGLIGIGRKNKIKVIFGENKFPNSLGLIYAAITYFLGWKSFYDEGIVMGLAPLGNYNKKIPKTNETYIDVFRKIIKKGNGLNYEIDKSWITYHYQRDTWLSDKFFKLFGKKRTPESKITDHYKNIAAALQKRIEEIVISKLLLLKKKYKIENLCIAGGVGLNCSLNGAIHDKKIFKKIFIKPASGDAGVSYGSALVSYFKKNDNNKFKNKNFYLGSRFSNNQIKKELEKHKKKLKFKFHKDITKVSADIIANKKILGWFQGAAEFGPRALGNRSIICQPFPAEMKDHLNKNVKFRESFRPFAPAVLDFKAKDFFNMNQDSEHMLIAVKVKNNKKNLIPAVVHTDNSSRTQTVSKKSNIKFYNLINNFYKISKIPIVVNTSFNIKGQPIVNDPNDAILCFMKYNIDYLAIGDYIVEKK